MARGTRPCVYSAWRSALCFSYYRVSTVALGASGLGLEAQREAVLRHVRGAGGAIVAEFQEVESGWV
jgi:hypothetical protein